jgi:hypothetical protein
MKKFISFISIIIFMILPNSFQYTFSNTLATSQALSSINLYPASVTQSGGKIKWGYINEDGKFTINPKYDIVKDFNDKGIAVAANGDNADSICTVYFINKNGTVVAGPFLSPVPEYHNNVAVIHDENKGSIVISNEGKILLSSKNYLYEYDEGLFNFSVTTSNQKTYYGYMDIKGKIVITAKYSNAYAFSDGNALVELSSNGYALIDKEGTVLEKYPQFPGRNTYSEGFKAFYDQKSKKYGYKDSDDNVVIKPTYDYADAFKDGVAKVSITDKNTGVEKSGLINKLGQYVLKPDYSGIEYLGQQRVAVSKGTSASYDYNVSKKAIYNLQGKQITGFNYYSISNYKDGVVSVCDDTNTFLIDLSGNVVKTFPKLKGVGEISYAGNLIKASIDGKLQYFDKEGRIIWSQDENYSLGDSIIVSKERCRPDYAKYIEYPQLKGLKNPSVQTKINNFMKATFLKESAKTKKTNDVYNETSDLKFTLERNKNLLILESYNYLYPTGAAHPSALKTYYHIDITNGKIYTLKDLFLGNANYTKVLSNFVNSQINRIKRINKVTFYNDFVDNKVTVSNNTKFIIGKESIKVYYDLYEIAPYVAGFPEFEISYGQLKNIINAKGDFWNSFDKTVSSNKPLIITNVDVDTKNKLTNIMQAYEKSIVDAVNSNNFNKVKVMLVENSILYKSQQGLITSLSRQGTKEKFKNCEVYAIIKDSEKNQYFIFVNEGISIKNQGKNFVDQYFNYCYTAVKDPNTNQYKLSKICKW